MHGEGISFLPLPKFLPSWNTRTLSLLLAWNLPSLSFNDSKGWRERTSLSCEMTRVWPPCHSWDWAVCKGPLAGMDNVGFNELDPGWSWPWSFQRTREVSDPLGQMLPKVWTLGWPLDSFSLISKLPSLILFHCWESPFVPFVNGEYILQAG